MESRSRMYCSPGWICSW